MIFDVSTTSTLWYAEDVEPGSRHALGSYTVTEAEILEFGRRWDSLPMHTDPEVAGASAFGGVIASGIHTMAMNQHLMSRGFLPRLALVAGKGITSLLLENPVRPDDVLTGVVHVLDVQTHGRRADLTTRSVLTNQRGERVLDMTGVAVVRARSGDDSAEMIP